MELYQWLLTLITTMLTAITYLMYTSSIRSEVVVYLRLDRFIAFICVENIGRGTARNIRFEFPCSFKIHGDRTLNDVNFFDKGIAILPTGHKKETFVASYAGGSGEVLKQKPIDITIYYKGYIYRRKTTCNIDFDEFQGMEVVGEPPLDKMAKSIEKIQKDLSGLMKKH